MRVEYLSGRSLSQHSMHSFCQFIHSGRSYLRAVAVDAFLIDLVKEGREQQDIVVGIYSELQNSTAASRSDQIKSNHIGKWT